MPTLKHRNPRYRKHRASGQAIVTLDGRDHYLGKHNTRASRQAYDRLIGQWLAGGRQLPTSGDLSVSELAVAFWRHAQAYYRKPDGTPTSTLHNYKLALRPLRRLYGPTRAGEFDALCLKAVRDDMVRAGWSRGTVNQAVNLLRGVFRWAVSEGMVPENVLRTLLAVGPLRYGRSEARETEPVAPVPERDIEAVKPYLSRSLRGLVELQLLSGARPGELVTLRAIDLDTAGGGVWVYRPVEHKGSHRGHARTIYFGPRAQEILSGFMANVPLDAYLFSPRQAVIEHQAARHQARKTPLNRGNRRGTNRKCKPKRQPGGRYSVDSYRRAIARACDAAGVPRWSPHKLRHNAASRLRREYGIDAAQTILGHRLGSGITEVYAEANVDKARQIMAKIG